MSESDNSSSDNESDNERTEQASNSGSDAGSDDDIPARKRVVERNSSEAESSEGEDAQPARREPPKKKPRKKASGVQQFLHIEAEDDDEEEDDYDYMDNRDYEDLPRDEREQAAIMERDMQNRTDGHRGKYKHTSPFTNAKTTAL